MIISQLKLSTPAQTKFLKNILKKEGFSNLSQMAVNETKGMRNAKEEVRVLLTGVRDNGTRVAVGIRENGTAKVVEQSPAKFYQDTMDIVSLEDGASRNISSRNRISRTTSVKDTATDEVVKIKESSYQNDGQHDVKIFSIEREKPNTKGNSLFNKDFKMDLWGYAKIFKDDNSFWALTRHSQLDSTKGMQIKDLPIDKRL